MHWERTVDTAARTRDPESADREETSDLNYVPEAFLDRIFPLTNLQHGFKRWTFEECECSRLKQNLRAGYKTSAMRQGLWHLPPKP
jgi:hypothetical protein